MSDRPICNASLTAALLVLSAIASTVGAADAPSSRPLVQPQPPVRPLLYYFEHFSLRRAAFLYEREIQALIAQPRQAADPVARLFTKATLYAAGVPTFDPTTVSDDMTRFMPQIGFETIRHGGYTIHVISMPPPEQATEAYFVAIVYKDGELQVEGSTAPSTRYITLEKTSVEGKVYALGEWDTNDRHKILGFGDREPTERDLLENIFALLADMSVLFPEPNACQ